MATRDLEEHYHQFTDGGPPSIGADPPSYRRPNPPPEYALTMRNRVPSAAAQGGAVRTSAGEEQNSELLHWDETELRRRLSIDDESDTSSVNENYYEASIASSIEDQLTWRGRMQVALHGPYLHYFIVALVVLDALIVLFELLLDVGAFGNRQCQGEGLLEQAEFCHFDSRSRDFCAPPAFLILEGLNISSSTDGILGLTSICRCRFRHGKFVCRDAESDVGINPGLVLHYVSISILSIFMIEILLKMIAFRLKYFTHKFEVFDGMVVVISWILDVASLKEEMAFEAISLLIILRLWRVVRIVNGAVLSSKAQADNQLKEVRKKARHVVHALHKSQDKVSTLTNENDSLKKTLKELQNMSDDTTPPLLQPVVTNGNEDPTTREE